ncbi:ABC transporter substrate-binding protein [Paenibacillus macerans]|uniref:ABC transporter substrate-binding protein n=1 Tax=Paenibacillus macerans TaxID=44252 RepID=UPI003D30FBDD
MKLHHQFLQLHARFGHNDGEGIIGVTLDELAATLRCTHRNALTVIHRMDASGWIEWISRRGRGARSTLRFRVQPGEIAAQSVMQAIDRKDVSLAIRDIRKHAGAASLQDQLQGWLLSYFGHHAEIRRDRQIDSLRLPIRQPLNTVDPLKMNLLAESFVASHVFDGLIRRANATGEIVPGLAHAWETDDRGTTWTFYLRKGVLFHNGSLLTAEDVLYTFERLARSSRRSLYSAIFRQIRAVSALSSNTVRMELKEPCELFLPCLCTTRAAIVPRNLDQRGEERFGVRPVGTGPFKVAVMEDDLCVLEAFPHYFQGQAHLDRIEIVHVPWELSSKERAAGDTLSPFHVIPGQASAENGTWSEMHSQVSVRKFVTCNTRKAGPLSDPQIRAKVFAALQSGEAAAEVPAGVAAAVADAPAGSPARQSAPEPDDSRSGSPLLIATITPYRPDADLVARRLEAAGYACQVLSSSAEEFKGDIRLQSDLIVFSLLRDQDEQLRLYDLYQTISEHVEPHRQTDVHKQLRTLAREPGPEARAGLFARMERQLIDGNELFILSEKPLQTAYLPIVRGVTFNGQGWVDLRNLWFPPQL